MTSQAADSAHLRTIPDGMAADAVARVDARLDAIEAGHGVRIALAVESGSRAWGFPSPDSDYDCRFVFVRPADDYLTPWHRRDVIETPIEDDLDVNGWDLGKAVQLLVKGNAVIVEWLTSPIVYRGQSRFRSEMLALAGEVATRERVARHYLHLGEEMRRRHGSQGPEVVQKRIFYILRPAAALRWLRLNPGEAVAPMHFPTLMETCDPPPELHRITAELLCRKAETRELGTAPMPDAIAAFVEEEFAAARRAFGVRPGPVDDGARRAAERFFRASVRRFDPAPG